MKTIGLILIISAITLFSCEDKFTDSDAEGTIYGTVTAEDVNTGNVDSIQILLINANYEPDTIICDNEAAIIDTVYTNTDGEFTFTKVEEGEYYVFPQKENYQLTGENISIDEVIEISGNDLIELSYSARQVLKLGKFALSFDIYNIPETGRVDIIMSRKVWYLFTPLWREDHNYFQYGAFDTNSVVGNYFNLESGYSILFYTLTNAFKFEVTINEITKTFYASIPITDFSSRVYFTCDWKTEEVKQNFK